MPLLTPAQAPPLVPAPFGLLSLDGNVDPGNTHWQSGVDVETRSCSTILRVGDACDSNQSSAVWTPTDGMLGLCSYKTIPVLIQVELPNRSMFGFSSRDPKAWALEALEAGTQKALEHELWTGELATAMSYENRMLASTDATDITPSGGPVRIKYGLALLEGAIGDCGLGSPGVIHMRREVASGLGLRQVDGHLETNLGNLVVAGSGYPGTGPDGTDPAQGTWVYATGSIAWVLDDPVVYPDGRAQGVDLGLNSEVFYAERFAAASFEGCCVFAVQVDLALDYT